MKSNIIENISREVYHIVERDITNRSILIYSVCNILLQSLIC